MGRTKAWRNRVPILSTQKCSPFPLGSKNLKRLGDLARRICAMRAFLRCAPRNQKPQELNLEMAPQ